MISIAELKERETMVKANLLAVQKDMGKPVGEATIPFPIPLERMLQKKLLEYNAAIRDAEFKQMFNK